jgi:hypothetical protein
MIDRRLKAEQSNGYVGDCGRWLFASHWGSMLPSDRLKAEELTTPILVIDRMGSEDDHASRAVENLVSTRLDNNRLTIVTSRLVPDLIAARYPDLHGRMKRAGSLICAGNVETAQSTAAGKGKPKLEVVKDKPRKRASDSPKGWGEED